MIAETSANYKKRSKKLSIERFKDNFPHKNRYHLTFTGASVRM